VLSINPGFTAEHLLVMPVFLDNNKYRNTRTVVRYYKQLIERLRRYPLSTAVGADDGAAVARSAVTSTGRTGAKANRIREGGAQNRNAHGDARLLRRDGNRSSNRTYFC